MNTFKYFLITCLILIPAPTLWAQSQEKAKKLFNEGKYAEAKPLFQSLVKKNPRNGSLNYWYGVCCYETGEAHKCLSHLEYAAERKVREAHRYLALYFTDNYRFSEAEECWETYFELMEKAKKPTDAYQQAYDRSSIGRQMLHSVQQVTFIDSFVVDKVNFLSTYHLSKESGNITTYNTFFQEESQPEGIVYQTEMKNKIYFSAISDNEKLQLYSADLLGNQWGNSQPLKGLETDSHANFPYMLSDGSTFYFAAEGENSLGGYDIFVTRYNAEENIYWEPENIGMPFNSPFNDYMYVIDEYSGLGWFASDRYQPEGKVCIYVFLPNDESLTLDEDLIAPDTLRQRARLTSIADTQTDEEKTRLAKQTLASLLYNQPTKVVKKEFEFIIDDLTTYVKLTDFHSPKARELFKQWQQSCKDHASLLKKLNDKRDTYARSQAQQRNAMTAEILDLEKRVEDMESANTRLETEIRNTEISSMK